MRDFFRWLPLSMALLVIAMPGRGEEKGGFKIDVFKKTLDRSDQRFSSYYTSRRIDRLEGLKIVIKNQTFKPMPDGEMKWEMLNRKHYSSTVESVSGTEKLNALRPAEAVEFVIGGVQTEGYRDSSSSTKDKVEWQIIIMQGGKEVVKVNSTPAFDSLSSRAIKLDPPKQDPPKK